MMRWLIVVLQAVGLAILGFGAFIVEQHYSEYLPDRVLVNQLVCLFGFCFLQVAIRWANWAEVRLSFLAAGALVIGGLATGLLLDDGTIVMLLSFKAHVRSGITIALGYAFLAFAVLHSGILLVTGTHE